MRNELEAIREAIVEEVTITDGVELVNFVDLTDFVNSSEKPHEP